MRALSTSTLSTQKSTSNHWGVLFSQITSLDTALQCFSYFLLKVEFFAPLLHLYSYIPISIKLYLCNSVIVLCWTWKGRQTTATTKLYCSSFLLTKITVFSVFTSFHAQLANQNQTAVEQNQYLMPTFSFQWFAGENTSKVPNVTAGPLSFLSRVAVLRPSTGHKYVITNNNPLA